MSQASLAVGIPPMWCLAGQLAMVTVISAKVAELSVTSAVTLSAPRRLLRCPCRRRTSRT
jgi:hypothetical protein